MCYTRRNGNHLLFKDLLIFYRNHLIKEIVQPYRLNFVDSNFLGFGLQD